MKTGLWRVLIICIAVIMLGGCGLFPNEEEVLAPPLTTPKDVQYRTEKVVRLAEMNKKIPMTATFVSSVSKTLAYEFEGRFEAFDVMLGENVDVDTVITKLNLGDFAFSIEQAEINIKQKELALQSAKTDLSNARTDSGKASTRVQEALGQMNRDLAALQTKIAEQPSKDRTDAKAAYDKVVLAEKDAERAMEKAGDELMVATRKYEEAHKKYINMIYAPADELQEASEAEADAKMGLNQAAAKRDDTIAALTRATQNTQAALIEYNNTIKKLDNNTYHDWVADENDIRNTFRAAQDNADAAKRRVVDSEEAVARAELDLESALNARAQLDSQNTKSALVSPIKGVVDWIDPKLKKGDIVIPFNAIARVVDPTALQIEVEAGALNNVKASTGMQGELTFKNKTYPCELVSTPADLSATKTMTEEEIRERNKYVFMCDPMPEEAKQGDTGQITIYLDHRENVLAIPIQAVRRSSGRSYVLVMDGEKRVEVNITTGLEEGTMVEVTEGLEEGQEVILQ